VTRRFSTSCTAAAATLFAVAAVACSDSETPLAPETAESPNAVALHNASGRDLITDDPTALATRFREIGTGDELLVWLKDPRVAPRSASVFTQMGMPGQLVIGLPRPQQGQEARHTIEPFSRPGGALNGLLSALQAQGAEVPIKAALWRSCA
jgi:hypothetical protein